MTHSSAAVPAGPGAPPILSPPGPQGGAAPRGPRAALAPRARSLLRGGRFTAPSVAQTAARTRVRGGCPGTSEKAGRSGQGTGSLDRGEPGARCQAVTLPWAVPRLLRPRFLTCPGAASEAGDPQPWPAWGVCAAPTHTSAELLALKGPPRLTAGRVPGGDVGVSQKPKPAAAA